MSDQPEKSAISAARYFVIATMLPVSTFAGYGIGYWLDGVFSTRYLKMVFLILGVVGGFIQLIQQLSRDMKSK